jgi:hypothetical protein
MIFSPKHLDEYFIVQFPVDFLGFDTEIKPFEYLEFARLDLSDGNESRNLINSLGNAKRALHLQVETIADGYGYRKLSKSSKFPPKLEFLSDIGIATPSIISKLNTLRNKVEHDYIVPDLEQIQDYCDIVELFLRATEGPINTFPSGVEFESNESFDIIETKSPRKSPLPEMLTIDVVKFEGEIKISGSDIDSSNAFEQIVTTANAEYSRWINQILKHTFRRV